MSTDHRRYTSGSPYEPRIGFCRALRTGDRILVAGTAPLGPDGVLVGPDDPHTQMRRCLEVVANALAALGGRLTDVVRTRVYLTRRDDHEAVARAHGEIFGAIRPVSTFVVVAGLLDPAWRVEVEAEAVLPPTRPPGYLDEARLDEVEAVWAERPRGGPARPRADRVEGLAWRGAAGRPLALLTLLRDGDVAEVVTLDALPPARGQGSLLLAAAEPTLARRGIERLRVLLTSDQLRPLAFFRRHGYRLTDVQLAADQRDTWTLEKRIHPPSD